MNSDPLFRPLRDCPTLSRVPCYQFAPDSPERVAPVARTDRLPAGQWVNALSDYLDSADVWSHAEKLIDLWRIGAEPKDAAIAIRADHGCRRVYDPMRDGPCMPPGMALQAPAVNDALPGLYGKDWADY